MLNGLAILLLVLLVFSLSVYAFVQQRSYEQVKTEISIIADSAISSIDFDETERNDAGEPDLLSSVIPEESVTSLRPLRLQWFNPQGMLKSEKGSLAMNLPFTTSALYQIQNEPHAIVLTRPALANGNLLGYVRVAKPLAQLDKQMMDLSMGLFLGTLAALAVSACGSWWLLRLSLRPTEHMIARLRQFVADASHELRSPLMVVKTNCEAALRLEDDKDSRQGTKLVAIKSANDQMITLTEDLLSLTDVEQEQRLGSNSIPVNLTSILSQYLSSRKRVDEHNDKDIALMVDLPETLFVAGKPEEIRRLFVNVIENAFRYTPAPGQVRITGEKNNKQVRINVEDTGIGISAYDLPKIFDRFWRADQARSYRGGNGLGLAIAQSIATAYGGSIEATSELGVGTKFAITLPAAIKTPSLDSAQAHDTSENRFQLSHPNERD
jgi:signal transduction histidine kinase